MKQRGKKLLAYFLSLALVLGLMPWMHLTAYRSEKGPVDLFPTEPTDEALCAEETLNSKWNLKTA